MILLKFIKAKNKSTLIPALGIDVKQRIATLSNCQLLRSADSYFSKFTTNSIQFKKPFSDPTQSTQLTQHLGMLFRAAELFRGAKVLDFGCGTGWLSLGIAQMGCDISGIDISPSAVGLAEKLKASRHMPSDGSLSFCTYDGDSLPFLDETFDRIVCFDSFHHVRNQQASLREFSRVLKQGGRIAFVEPGPEHSKTFASQTEMANYNVIENDIDLPRLSEWAGQLGMNTPQILLQFQHPVQVGIEDFNIFVKEGISRKASKNLLRTLLDGITDTQCFYIQKGHAKKDSRQVETLEAELNLISAKYETGTSSSLIKFTMSLRNTGRGCWLTSPGSGQVKLGVQLFSLDGLLINLDYDRFKVTEPSVEVNQEVLIRGVVHLPALDNYQLRFDLVAEDVAWLSHIGKVKQIVLNSTDFKGLNSAE
jgi:2-polyprenyl-3-methyl-5-hydroxy-6-metoxy-1,4-benzoquinol methylase